MSYFDNNEFNVLDGTDEDWFPQLFSNTSDSVSFDTASDASSEPSTESEKNTPDYLYSGSDTDDQSSNEPKIEKAQANVPKKQAALQPVKKIEQEIQPKKEKPITAKKRKLNDESAHPTATVSSKSSSTKPIRGRKRTEDEKKRDEKRLLELSSTEFLTPEEIEEKKILTNRKTASDSRKRKKQEKENFQDSIATLQAEIQQLRAWILLAFQTIPLIQLLPLGIPSFITPIMLTTLQSQLIPGAYGMNVVQQQPQQEVPATNSSSKKKQTTATVFAFAFLFCIFAFGRPFFFNSLFSTSSEQRLLHLGNSESPALHNMYNLYLPSPDGVDFRKNLVLESNSNSLIVFDDRNMRPEARKRRVFSIPAESMPKRQGTESLPKLPQLPSIDSASGMIEENDSRIEIVKIVDEAKMMNLRVLTQNNDNPFVIGKHGEVDDVEKPLKIQLPSAQRTVFSSFWQSASSRKENATASTASLFSVLMKNFDVQESGSKISKIWKNLKFM